MNSRASDTDAVAAAAADERSRLFVLWLAWRIYYHRWGKWVKRESVGRLAPGEDHTATSSGEEINVELIFDLKMTRGSDVDAIKIISRMKYPL